MAARTVDKTVELTYDHCARIKERSRPSRKCNEYRAISVFWEIGGVKAHYLIDSGCEGVIISPEFTRAATIKTFALEKPIGIQLAVMGSKSVINYGTNTTIKINRIEGVLRCSKYWLLRHHLRNTVPKEIQTRDWLCERLSDKLRQYHPSSIKRMNTKSGKETPRKARQ